MIQYLIDALRLPKHANAITLPSGTKLIPRILIDDYPNTRNGVVVAESLDSLVDYTALYQQVGTRIFASLQKMNIVTVLDWHDEADCEAGAWGDHSATFGLSYTRAWREWTNISGRQLSQLAFAEFIEEHLDHITAPKAADVLTVATSLSGMRKVAFTNAVRLANGDTCLQYEETTDAKAAGDVKVPSQLTLRIPVFQGAEDETTFEVTGLFRYRLNDGKLSFELKLLHIEDIAELAFANLLKELRQKLIVACGDTAPIVFSASMGKAPRAILTEKIITA
jgi:uncharacterized protein YfdQ (DUF2303 family)